MYVYLNLPNEIYIRIHRWNQQHEPALAGHGLFTLLVRLLPPISSRTLWCDIGFLFVVPYQSNPTVSWCQWIPCKMWKWQNEIQFNVIEAHNEDNLYVFSKINTYLWLFIRFVNVFRSCLSKISYSSRTASTCSGFDRFGTCKTDVNADNISISSSTCLMKK